MSGNIEDKHTQIEFPKSLYHRPILTSRKRLKFKKIKKSIKNHKKYHRIINKVKKNEKYEENNTNKKKLIINEYPKILLEKDNLNKNNLKFEPIPQINEINNQNEPKKIINIKYEPIKKVEDSNLFLKNFTIIDNNQQNNTFQQIQNNNSDFGPNKFKFESIINSFETNNFSEDLNYHFSPFIPIRKYYNVDNLFNSSSLFPEYQDNLFLKNDTSENYFASSNLDQNLNNFSNLFNNSNDNLFFSNINRNNDNLTNNRNNNFFINENNNININISAYLNNRINENNNIHNGLNRIRNNRRNFHFDEPRKIKCIKEKLSKIKIKKVKNLEDKKKSCIICLEDFKNYQNIYTLPCSHIFHIHCLNKEIKLRQKCPICRKELK